MELKTLVRKYSTIFLEIQAIKEKNGIVEKEEELAELQNQIKDVARQANEDEIEQSANSHFTVRVDRPFKSWYDLEAIKKFGKKSEVQLIEKEALKVEVDKPKLEELVKSGLISRELRQKSFREEALTPRVSIVLKDHEN